MSADRLYPPKEVAEIVEGAIRRAHLVERLRCSNVALQFPIEHFVYDTRSHGDVLRLRDAISECIKKGLEPGQADT